MSSPHHNRGSVPGSAPFPSSAAALGGHVELLYSQFAHQSTLVERDQFQQRAASAEHWIVELGERNRLSEAALSRRSAELAAELRSLHEQYDLATVRWADTARLAEQWRAKAESQSQLLDELRASFSTVIGDLTARYEARLQEANGAVFAAFADSSRASAFIANARYADRTTCDQAHALAARLARVGHSNSGSGSTRSEPSAGFDARPDSPSPTADELLRQLHSPSGASSDSGAGLMQGLRVSPGRAEPSPSPPPPDDSRCIGSAEPPPSRRTWPRPHPGPSSASVDEANANHASAAAAERDLLSGSPSLGPPIYASLSPLPEAGTLAGFTVSPPPHRS
jgi:hypothetical protein